MKRVLVKCGYSEIRSCNFMLRLTDTHGNALPDRIILFQGSHEREAEDEEDLIASIAETLIHEVGHYFGLSEEEIEEIEEQYWRGDAQPD